MLSENTGRTTLLGLLCGGLLLGSAVARHGSGWVVAATSPPSATSQGASPPTAAADTDAAADTPTEEPRPLTVSDATRTALDRYCVACHSGDEAAADVRLDGWTGSRTSQLELLNRVQEQLFFGLMPPADADQPSAADRDALASGLSQTLRAHNASRLDEKRRYPAYGNYVDHDQLFDPANQVPAFTPARRWLVSPQIFHERVIDVFRLEGRERDNHSKYGRTFYGVTNPFLLPDHSGVRYYDLTTLDGGHLLVMMNNARWIADKQLRAARVKRGEIRADEFADNRDRWFPRTTPAPLEAIVLNEGRPSQEQLTAAIICQFEGVLQRAPSDEELAEYRTLAREAMELSGNTAGLRQMLIAVLLESEFLYRLEFGDGDVDASGRQMLSPRELSYAIAYALGDRGPDPSLVQAAAQGRLATRDDVRREVERLLREETWFRGQIDSSLNGKHYRSNETSHPRIVRFFREFFGYPGALKVFKDAPRSEGYYRNPGRGSQATPGWLTLEADRFVTMHVERDERVFERLLTGDEFFVYHDKDNQTGQQIIDEWRSVYERLRDTDWRTDPEAVLEEHLEFLQARPAMRIKDTSRPGELVNFMHYFEESFGQGRTPFTTVPWAHGYTFHHAPFYSLPPTPGIYRYGSWKSTKLQQVEPRVFWDYPVAQPFPIANRRGMLTHPAWLIAHSSNFHTDPIRRGRWIREKLLAGRVPDIPITVDAQVPEDPHRTLRERVESVTHADACWKCHQHMNPLGMAFEVFDDFGRYRLEEPLEHPDNLLTSGNGKTTFDVYKTAAVDTTGRLTGSGDSRLDGDVSGPFDLIDRLVKSDRVRQSIIRHAFRFYMGRNEMLSDARTLQQADRAYLDSGGSFRAVIVSLLTSDSFLYRKPMTVDPGTQEHR